jgi:hypothetical protein
LNVQNPGEKIIHSKVPLVPKEKGKGAIVKWAKPRGWITCIIGKV